MDMDQVAVKTMIVPVPIGKMDVRHVCVKMPHGAMELKVIIMMMITLRKMEWRIRLVIAILKTGNAIQFLVNRVLFACLIGSVVVDFFCEKPWGTGGECIPYYQRG